jgi:hypothetical protein
MVLSSKRIVYDRGLVKRVHLAVVAEQRPVASLEYLSTGFIQVSLRLTRPSTYFSWE